MNVCFLDIDGVLNGSKTAEKTPSGFIGVDKEMLCYLAPILNRLSYNIVLTSSWKNEIKPEMKPDGEYLLRALKEQSLSIISMTPDIRIARRGLEIRGWLSQHPETEKYIILDDVLFDYEKHANIYDHLILTNIPPEYNGIFSARAFSERPTEEVLEFLNILKD